MMRRRWKILLWISAAIAVVAIGAVGTHLRAKHAVQVYRGQLAARGEKLTIAELAPRRLITGSNGVAELLAAFGMWKSDSYDYVPSARKYIGPGRARVAWRQPVLGNRNVTNVWPWLGRYLETNRQALAQARSALEYPVLDFNLDYSQGFNVPIAHLAAIKATTQRLSAGVLFELHENRPAAAWENLRALNALPRNYTGEPVMISQLVRLAICHIALAATWEALQFDGWGEAQLEELQAGWQSLRLLPEIEPVLGMERAMQEQAFATGRASYSGSSALTGAASASGNDSLSDLVDLGKELADDPSGGLKGLMQRFPRYWAWKWWWSYEEELCNLQICQAGIETARRSNARSPLVPTFRELKLAFAEIAKGHPNSEKRFIMMGQADGSFLEKFFLKVAMAEAQREMATTAIALKRYHARDGKYPDQLAKLVPEFLPKLPTDFLDGKPLRYRLNPDNTYLLYSVGEDGEDNNGDPTPVSSLYGARVWWLARDAVWPSPASAAEVAADEAKMNSDRARKVKRE